MEGYKFRVCGNGGQHYYSIINDKYLTRFSVPLHPKPLDQLRLAPGHEAAKQRRAKQRRKASASALAWGDRHGGGRAGERVFAGLPGRVPESCAAVESGHGAARAR